MFNHAYDTSSCVNRVRFPLCHFNLFLWILENALKKKIEENCIYKCCLCHSLLAVRQGTSAKSVNLRPLKCNWADKVHFTLVPRGSGEWLQCNVSMWNLCVISTCNVDFLLNDGRRHGDILNVCIFESVLSILQTWPVDWGGLTAKRMLGLFAVSLLCSPSLLSIA